MTLTQAFITGFIGLVILIVSTNCTQFCRTCTNARSQDDCTTSVICGSNERCYTEEVITPTGIIYNAGCLAFDTCQDKHSIGKKRSNNDHLIACARCCLGGNKNETNHDCNARLCGLPGTAAKGTSTLARCYNCEHAHSLDQCNDFTICGNNEVCYSETHIINSGSGQTAPVQFYFGCARKDVCVAGTKIVLQNHDRITGKREQVGCRACCSGDYCNTADCKTLYNKLYTLSKNGHLDFNTLTYKP